MDIVYIYDVNVMNELSEEVLTPGRGYYYTFVYFFKICLNDSI